MAEFKALVTATLDMSRLPQLRSARVSLETAGQYPNPISDLIGKTVRVIIEDEPEPPLVPECGDRPKGVTFREFL